MLFYVLSTKAVKRCKCSSSLFAKLAVMQRFISAANNKGAGIIWSLNI